MDLMLSLLQVIEQHLIEDFIRLCELEVSGDVVYKTKNPFRRGHDIYFTCDVPCLVKTARNCFSNSNAHKNSKKLMVSSPL